MSDGIVDFGVWKKLCMTKPRRVVGTYAGGRTVWGYSVALDSVAVGVRTECVLRYTMQYA
jgi:hypothetical protein